MDSEKNQEFISYLDSRTSSVQEDIRRLIADNPKDEADFEKIRANIFQIIKTISQTSTKVSQEESERTAFLNGKLTLFQETWEGFLTKAREHEDDLKILQEQTKLEALAEIRDAFQRIWG